MPASRITRAHLSCSLVMNAANACGRIADRIGAQAQAAGPSSAGSFRMRTISPFSRLDDFLAALLAGASQPNQPTHLETRKTRFRHRRQFGRQRRALRAGDRQRADPARLHLRHGRERDAEQRLHLPADHARSAPDRRLCTARVSPGCRTICLNCSSARWPEVPLPAEANANLPRRRLGQRDQFLDRSARQPTDERRGYSAPRCLA